METTIYKTVKGSTLEALFDKCDLFSIRFYNTVKTIEEKDYIPERKYKFEIKVRHPEDTDANVLFERALNIKSVTINNINFKMLKAQKAELVRLQFYPEKYNLSKKQVDAITGITNLLDAIQDANSDQKRWRVNAPVPPNGYIQKNGGDTIITDYLKNKKV